MFWIVSQEIYWSIDEIVMNSEHIGNRKRIIVLILTLAISIISGEVFLNIAPLMGQRMLAIMKCLIYVFDFLVAWIAMKINRIRLEIDVGNVRQYIVGIILGLILLVIMAGLGAMTGMPTGGGINQIVVWKLVYELVFYLCFVGPAEELLYRVFVQETLIKIFPNQRFWMITLCALIFGLSHWRINGSWIQVCIATCIGLYFGLAKEYIKNCTIISLSICHGLYNALNGIILLFL